MNLKMIILFMFVGVTIASCSTFRGADIPLNKTSFYIELSGNGFSEPEKLKADFKIRAKELCGRDIYYSKLNLRSRVPFAQLPGIAMCKTPGFCPATEASFPVVIGVVSCDGDNQIIEYMPPNNELLITTTRSLSDVSSLLYANIKKCFSVSKLPLWRELDVLSSENENTIIVRSGGLLFKEEVVNLVIKQLSSNEILLSVTQQQSPIGSWNMLLNLSDMWLSLNNDDCWDSRVTNKI